MDSCTTECKKQLEAIDAVLHEVSRRLGKLYDALETDKLRIDDLAPRIQELRERQAQLTLAKEKTEEVFADRKVQLSDLRFVEKCADDSKELLPSKSTLAERRGFIRTFAKDIRVKDGKAKLMYTIPLPPNNLASSEASVLSLVQLGSGGWIRTSDLRVMSPTSFHCSTPRPHSVVYTRSHPSATKSPSRKQGISCYINSHCPYGQPRRNGLY